MALPVVNISDFIGFHAIARNARDENITLQQFIDRHQKFILYDLLGKVLADLYIEDLDEGEPQTAIYETIHEELIYTSGTLEMKSRGIKEILKGIIFYFYVSETLAEHGQSGVEKVLAEASVLQGFENGTRFAEKRWNDIIESWETIQAYCRANPEDYPDFNGKEIKPKYSAIL